MEVREGEQDAEHAAALVFVRIHCSVGRAAIERNRYCQPCRPQELKAWGLRLGQEKEDERSSLFFFHGKQVFDRFQSARLVLIAHVAPSSVF